MVLIETPTSRMETRRRGGGNQSRKHHLQTITRRKSTLPAAGASHSDLPESDGTAERHAANLPVTATPRRGAAPPDNTKATRQE
jgi:hypothetical protein